MKLQQTTGIANRSAANATLDIDSLVKTKLPPLPGSVVRILDLIQDPDIATRILADEVGHDPALTARILRLANSPIYFLQRKVTSIQQAINVIGVKSLYDMLMISVAADSFSYELRNSIAGRIIWEHSLAVALCARDLSMKMGLRGSEEVFICGLLHDIGKLMLLHVEPDKYSNILEITSEEEMLSWEVETFGYDHSEIAAIIARAWKLPDDIGRTILNHHNASSEGGFGIVAHLINLADIVANVNGFGLRLEEPELITSSYSKSFLKLSDDQIEASWIAIKPDLDEIIGVFS